MFRNIYEKVPTLNRLPFILSAAAISFTIYACSSSSPDATAVLDGMLHRYADFVLHMESDSIAALFTENGEVVNPHQPTVAGRDTILKYLNSFGDFKVLEEKMDADSTKVSGRTAVQTGHYFQRVTVPGGHTVEVSGRFRIYWIMEKGKWLIRREETLAGK